MRTRQLYDVHSHTQTGTDGQKQRVSHEQKCKRFPVSKPLLVFRKVLVFLLKEFMGLQQFVVYCEISIAIKSLTARVLPPVAC